MKTTSGDYNYYYRFLAVVCFIGPEKPQWEEADQVYIT